MPINYQQKKNTNTVFGGTDAIVVPIGNSDQRSGTELGQLRYNTTTGLAEFYTATGWAGVDAPPTVSNISGTINENTNSTITITGTNFKTGSVVYITGSAVSNVERSLTTTYVNQTTLTAATNATSVNYVGGASFGIKVLNPSGLSGQLDNAGSIDRDPVWSTNAGNIATIADEYGSYSPIATVSASDPDGSAVSYSVSSGSLPGNVSLNTSNGQISGNPTNVESATTFTFEITATSNGQSTPRSFNIILNPALDGTSSARAATSAANIKSVVGSPESGVYWLRSTGINSNTPFQVYCDFTLDGGIGYAVYFQELFESTNDGGSDGYEFGPTHSEMQSTSYTGTAGWTNEFFVHPYLFPIQYNNGSGASRMIVYNKTTTGGSSAGGITSTTYKAVRFTGLSGTNMRDIWAGHPSVGQYTPAYETTGNSGRTSGSGTAYILGSHGTSGGVSQWVSGGTGNVNNFLVFEYKPNAGSDPNHYWMVDTGQNGSIYFRENNEYGPGGATFRNRYGGIAVF
jgi:hypothetical protein